MIERVKLWWACRNARWDQPCHHNCWKCHDRGHVYVGTMARSLEDIKYQPGTDRPCDCPAAVPWEREQESLRLRRFYGVDQAETRRKNGTTHTGGIHIPRGLL